MTNEEAMRDISCYIGDGCYNGDNSLDYETLIISLKAISKQIPKKHKMVDNVLYCPSCESYHGRYGDIRIPVGSDFCPYCGQAIDWSEEE